MAKSNRTCLACRKKYSYCPTCSRADALKPRWYSEFCCETCKDLWKSLVKFNMGMLTKEETREIISNLELKPLDSYAACVQRDYAKVMVKPKKAKKIEPVVDMVPVVEEIAEPIVFAEPIIEEPVAELHEVVIEAIE